ncbi:MAG: hypothetical protein SPE28_06845 [Eubacteriales bacterium]|nr:hypothetical protein [Eubacteriales bacterium]
MIKLPPVKKIILWLTAVLMLFSAIPAQAGDGRLVTQNWAGSAVFYDVPCDETESFHMTDDEFLCSRLSLENRLIYAYSAYLNSLDGDEREALVASQKAWIRCYYAYDEALKQLWLEPVKIYFGVTGQERRTNVYREAMLLLLINRITDLEEWSKGRLVRLDAGMAEQKAAELEEALTRLRVKMGLCLYVIQEEYRPRIMDAHRAYFDFFDANGAFLELISKGDRSALLGEKLLQANRMAYITGVHYQGCRFFRREREE